MRETSKASISTRAALGDRRPAIQARIAGADTLVGTCLGEVAGSGTYAICASLSGRACDRRVHASRGRIARIRGAGVVVIATNRSKDTRTVDARIGGTSAPVVAHDGHVLAHATHARARRAWVRVYTEAERGYCAACGTIEWEDAEDRGTH